MGILDFVKGGVREMAIARPDAAKDLWVYKHPDQTIPMKAQLTVDAQRIGVLPAKVALAEGVHELVISRGDRLSYRYVSVRAGKSWVLREP